MTSEKLLIVKLKFAFSRNLFFISYHASYDAIDLPLTVAGEKATVYKGVYNVTY